MDRAEIVERGWLPLARTMARFQRDPVASLEALFRESPATVVFPLRKRSGGRRRRLVVTRDPAVARPVLQSSSFRNSALTLSAPQHSAQWRLRHNLFRMHGSEHRRQQQLLAPTLRKRMVETYRDGMVAILEEALARWRPGCRLDMALEMKTLARRIAAATLFGQAQLEESDRLGEAMERWFATSFWISTRALPRGLPGGPRRRMLARAEEIERRVAELVRRRRAEGLTGSDLVSRLIRERDEQGGLREEELVSQLHVLFLAAHETTAYALAWALFLIAQHPRLAGRLAQEIETRVGDKAPSTEQLDALELLSHTIDETLRIIPVIPYGARVAAEAAQAGAIELPRGSRVIIAYAVMHHRPEVFPDPKRFRPERWIGFEPPPYHYLPFSAGPHMCLGPSFALLTMKLTLTMLLQRFRPRLVPGARIDRRSTVTLSPRGGLPMRLLGPEAPFERAPIRGNILEMVDLSG